MIRPFLTIPLGSALGLLSTLAIVATLALAGCAHYAPPQMDQAFVDYARQSYAEGKELVIWNNYGGSVMASTEVRALMRKGLKIKVLGTCGSACTYLLIEKNICYAPDSAFAFHAISTRGLIDHQASETMKAQFPPHIADRLNADASMAGTNVTTYSAQTIAGLDEISRTCGS